MNHSIPYKNILAEIRPALQSVNVYITFKRARASDYKIELTDAGFNIINGDATEAVELNKTVAKRNLSVLAAKENYFVFRFSMEEQTKAGTLNTEIINIMDRIAALRVPEQRNLLGESKINCAHCSEELNCTVLKKTITGHFEVYEPNEWYCHSHNIPDCSDRPKNEEFLIGPTGYYVAKNMVVNRIKEVDKCLMCCNCSTLIGREVTGGTYKLYLDSVKVTTCDDVITILPFEATIRVLENSSLTNQKKFILVSHLPGNHKEYLVLWVIEENLLVYKINENRESDTHCTYKVLFKHETSFTSLVEKWCKDFNTVLIDISPNMMRDTLDFLHQTNSLIPTEFGSSNGFHLSFLHSQRNN